MQNFDISVYMLRVIETCAKFKVVPNPSEGLSSGSSFLLD